MGVGERRGDGERQGEMEEAGNISKKAELKGRSGKIRVRIRLTEGECGGVAGVASYSPWGGGVGGEEMVFPGSLRGLGGGKPGVFAKLFTMR